MKYIYKLCDITKKDKLHFGGKAESLSKMMIYKLPVPDGYAIAAEAFIHGKLIEEARAELSQLQTQLSKRYHRYTYAVRSSAVGEDGIKDSFAGAYETVLNVMVLDLCEAVALVVASAENERVLTYSQSRNIQKGSIAVIIQRMVNPDYAGVLFTADMITGSSSNMIGNYVRGLGESLVSGECNAERFSINAIKYSYNGNLELKKYAKKLYQYAVNIKKCFGTQQDIEWAVSGKKVYILQSRPITTLSCNDEDTYHINDTFGEELLLSKTNVGEIFMRPMSPMTHSVIRSMFDIIGFPLIVNVCGQPYGNISGVCSVLVALGVKREKAYSMIADIAGKLPKEITIPIYPIDRTILLLKIFRLIFQKKNKNQVSFGKDFAENIVSIGDELIEKIHKINDPFELSDFWYHTCDVYVMKVLKTIMGSLSVKPLFKTRQRLEVVVGERLTDELLSNCSAEGMIESLKPLIAIEDVISGTISKEDYIKHYGHRHANEMELSCPYPYENPNFLQNMIDDYLASGVNANILKSTQEERFQLALKEFVKRYPSKIRWLKKTIKKYSAAVYKREYVRSQSVKLFCLMREFLLKAASMTNLGEDVFMLQFTEVIDLLKGNKEVIEKIPLRRQNYNKYLSMPAFPNVIYGRFDPEVWMKDENRRSDFYQFGESRKPEQIDEISGIAGSSGTVKGIVRLLKDISEAEQFQKGEILVTTAANIGWIKLFPKAAAIVTDIGAPLSHAIIVARELGIPAVVGCGNAVDLLKTGDNIVVDGAAGKVYINHSAIQEGENA